jgi:hypothetical protein
MPSVNYTAIVDAIKAALENDSSLIQYGPRPVRVMVEDSLGMGIAEQAPCIIIQRGSRRAPPGMQVLAAGRKTMMEFAVTLTCIEYDMDSPAAGMSRLDELVSRAEIALMRDRTLGDTCRNFVLDGGNFDSIGTGNNFIVGAEIKMLINVSTSY